MDTRNDYEVALGTFDGAQDPNADFSTVAQVRRGKSQKTRQTQGGDVLHRRNPVREASHLLENGYDEVYHLKGGILNYLERSTPIKANGKASAFFLIIGYRSLMG